LNDWLSHKQQKVEALTRELV